MEDLSTYRRRSLLFRVNAEELNAWKTNFYSGSTNLTRFGEDIFYRDGQRKPQDLPFTLVFVVIQAISFEAAQQIKQTRFLPALLLKSKFTTQLKQEFKSSPKELHK